MSSELKNNEQEVILGFTDGEYDDWGACELSRMICNNTGRKLVLVLCYRSKAILEQMASDARRLLPGVTVLMGPEDKGRDGGYPMDAPHDGLATPRFTEYPANTRMILGLSLLDAMLLPFPHLWKASQAPNQDADVIADGFVSGIRMTCRLPALFIYGGGYNLRTDLSKALFAKWPGAKASFDGWPAFGNRTNLYQSGPYIQALQQKKADGSAIAAHILHVGRTWNEFLSAKFVGEITEWYHRHRGIGRHHDVLERAEKFVNLCASIKKYEEEAKKFLDQFGDDLDEGRHAGMMLESGMCRLLEEHLMSIDFFPPEITDARRLREVMENFSEIEMPSTPLNRFFKHLAAKRDPGVRVSDLVRERMDLANLAAGDVSKYWNKLRILKAMQADPLQGCTADMFAALLAVLYRPGVGTIGASFRLALSIDEEKKTTERFSASGAKRIARCNDELREVFREEMEALAAEAIRTDGASLGAKIPILDS